MELKAEFAKFRRVVAWEESVVGGGGDIERRDGEMERRWDDSGERRRGRGGWRV